MASRVVWLDEAMRAMAHWWHYVLDVDFSEPRLKVALRAYKADWTAKDREKLMHIFGSHNDFAKVEKKGKAKQQNDWIRAWKLWTQEAALVTKRMHQEYSPTLKVSPAGSSLTLIHTHVLRAFT